MKANINDIKIGSKILAYDDFKLDNSLYEVIEIYKCIDGHKDNVNKTMFLVKNLESPSYSKNVICEDTIKGIIINIKREENQKEIDTQTNYSYSSNGIKKSTTNVLKRKSGLDVAM